MNFCTSEACRMTILLFAIFLAGYFILTNGNSKEAFEESNVESKKEECKQDDSIDADIKAVYKDVYGTDISAAKLKEIKQKDCLNKSNFDAEIFKRSLTAQRTSEVQDMVNKIFMDTIKRPPTPQEMEKYVELYLSKKMTTKEELVRILEYQPEKVVTDETRATKAQEAVTKQDYQLYKQIIDVYQKVLDRLPNSVELNNYFGILKTNKKFTLEKLEDALLASRENMILTMNQKNNVHGELAANITERQLQIVINAIYKSVYGYEPDKSTYNFLRVKFVSFNLDESKLIMFIKNLKSAEEGTTPVVPANSPNVSVNSKQPAQQASSQKVLEKYIEKKPDSTPFVMEKPTETLVSKGTQDTSETNSVNVYNASVQETKANTALSKASEPNQTTTDKIIDNIKQGGKCAFDKNSIDNVLKLNDKQLYADYILQRQGDTRSQYVNANNNMVLFPESKWEVPLRRPPVCYGRESQYSPLADQTALIGTLLEDAKDTKVGSVMPEFMFIEKTQLKQT